LNAIWALALGTVTGVAGFIPLLVAKHFAQHSRAAFKAYAIPIGLGCVFVSFAFLLAALFIAAQVAGEVFASFGIALVVSFLIASSVFAILTIRRGGQ
jgi:hypothetical protein